MGKDQYEFLRDYWKQAKPGQSGEFHDVDESLCSEIKVSFNQFDLNFKYFDLSSLPNYAEDFNNSERLIFLNLSLR